MSEKVYVTREEGEALSFNYDFKQIFHHESSQPKTLPEYVLVKWYIKQPEQTKQLALEVLDFLYKFTFATQSQLERMLRMKGLDPEGFDGILDALLDQRMLNFCYFSKFDQGGAPPEDAFRVYCLDFGAIAILSHFSSSDSITWFTTDVMRSTELVLKYLTTALFYLSLAETRGSALRYFKAAYDVSIGHRDIRFSGSFEIMQGSSPHPFIIESIRAFDLPVGWEDKVEKKVVPFSCQSKNWAKYFASEPVYLFLVEDEKQALEAASIFFRRTGKDNFRLITDGQLKGGLSKAAFYKYVPVEEEDPSNPGTTMVVPNKVGKLRKVRSSLLSGEAEKLEK
mgnify:CR=1 FL=1